MKPFQPVGTWVVSSSNNRIAILSNPRSQLSVLSHFETGPLFPDNPAFSCYRYSALVTDMDLPAAALWRLYRGRADCENRIKELKYDFGGESFNLKDF